MKAEEKYGTGKGTNGEQRGKERVMGGDRAQKVKVHIHV